MSIPIRDTFKIESLAPDSWVVTDAWHKLMTTDTPPPGAIGPAGEDGEPGPAGGTGPGSYWSGEALFIYPTDGEAVRCSPAGYADRNGIRAQPQDATITYVDYYDPVADQHRQMKFSQGLFLGSQAA